MTDLRAAPAGDLVVVEVPTALGLSPAPGGSGRPRGTWRAPRALRAAGLLGRLGAAPGPAIDVAAYDPRPEEPSGARNTAGLVAQTRALAEAITGLLDEGRRPLVVGGDCSVLVGAALAMRRRGRHGLLFLDGHLDFRHPGNAPRLSAAAGEELAIVTGRGLPALADIDGLAPYVRGEDVVALGEREHDEQTADARDAVAVVDLDALRRRRVADAGAAAVERLRDGGCRGLWLHLDVDVLDSARMPAVDSPQPGGLAPDELVALLRALTRGNLVVGLDVTVFDPELDEDGSRAQLLVDVLAAGLG